MDDYYQARSSYRSGGVRAMFDAVCAECGQRCKVPFRPTGKLPVYCNSCFQKHGKGNGNQGSFRHDGNHTDSHAGGRFSEVMKPDYQAQFDEINRKLETILDVVLGFNGNQAAGHKNSGLVSSNTDRKVVKS